MYRQQLEVRVSKLACASPADPGINPERLLAIGCITLFPVAPGFGNNTIQPVVARWN
jgi:hypothetical protein